MRPHALRAPRAVPRRGSARSRGFTLVELLVAVALSVIIIGMLATASVQAQRAATLVTLRQDAARAAVALLDDLGRDLSCLLPAAAAPRPFSPATGPAVRVLELEALEPRPAAARDRLRLLTTVAPPDGSRGRAFGLVEWSLAPRTADPGGGPDTGRVTRRIVSWARPGEATTTAGDAEVVLASGVLRFELEWQGSDGRFVPPDDTTRDGAAFALEGTVDVSQTEDGTLARATGSTAPALDALPIGADLRLQLPDGPALPLLVRRRPAPGDVLLSDRLEPVTGVAWSSFRGPPLLRASVVVLYGRGPEAATARFSRTFPVPR